MPTPLRKIFFMGNANLCAGGEGPIARPSNFFITETEGSKSPKMRRREAPDWKHEVSRAKPTKPIPLHLKQTKIKILISKNY